MSNTRGRRRRHFGCSWDILDTLRPSQTAPPPTGTPLMPLDCCPAKRIRGEAHNLRVNAHSLLIWSPVFIYVLLSLRDRPLHGVKKSWTTMMHTRRAEHLTKMANGGDHNGVEVAGAVGVLPAKIALTNTPIQ